MTLRIRTLLRTQIALMLRFVTPISTMTGFALATCSSPGAAIAQSPTAAPTNEQLTAACEMRATPSACTVLATRILEQSAPPPQDEVTAANYFDRACNLGGARGCFELAKMRHAGRGGERDLVAASAALEKACTGGISDACVARDTVDKQIRAERFVRNENPQPVETTSPLSPEEKKAYVDLTADSCKKGMATSCQRYATILRVAKDFNGAASVLEKSCELGSSSSCGEFLAGGIDGEGRAITNIRRGKIMELLCTKDGQDDQCVRLGDLLLSGALGKGQEERARSYFSLACQNLWPGACDRIITLDQKKK